MFNQSYAYYLVNKIKYEGQDLLETIIYSFRSEKRRCIVVAETYKLSTYAVKFYPVSHKLSPKKYNILLNDYHPAPVIRTCVNIMLDILNKNDKANFGFVASNTIEGNYIEPKYYNQRFRIYKKLMSYWFPDDLFLHTINEENITYLLLNRKNQNLESLAKSIVEMFIRNYEELNPEEN